MTVRKDICQPFHELVRIGCDRLPQRQSALASAPEGCPAPTGFAKLDPAHLGHTQRLSGAAGDGLAFGLCDEGHDTDGQIVRLGHVDGEEMLRQSSADRF